MITDCCKKSRIREKESDFAEERVKRKNEINSSGFDEKFSDSKEENTGASIK